MTSLSIGKTRSLPLHTIFLLAIITALAFPALASAELGDYGIKSVGASLSTLEAGRHPDVLTTIEFNEAPDPIADTESLAVELPPGLIANPRRFPSCSLATFNESMAPCSQDSQVGMVEVHFAGFPTTLQEPLYNLQSPDDKVARLGFVGIIYPYILQVDLRSESDYGVTARSLGMPSLLHLQSVKAKTWGVPADHAHDTERMTALEAFICAEIGATGPCLVGGSRESSLSPEPFMTNPASCQPMDFGFKTTAYGFPGKTFAATASAGNIIGCDRTPFDPSLTISPTSSQAGAPTGLEATLQLPQSEAPNTPGTSPLRGAKVVLPEGMTVNASAAEGLQGCSAEEAAYKTHDPAACPAASKLGSATFVSPALKRPIQGGIFLRTPEPGHLVRFWLVSSELGVNLKLPVGVDLDERTGRLTTLIQESPQLPVEKVVLQLNGGARAPLRNPQTCGTFNATYELDPWSGSPVTSGIVPITINQGCKTGGFDPKLSAGSLNPAAGAFSPFVFDITREDGDQNVAAIDLSLPKGLTAKLAGIPLCPDTAAASGSCPAGSQIGVVKAAVGAGSQPLWIPQPGKAPTAAYLGGPYRGAPYSVIAKVPAQAGPFDLGIVSVRSAINVDPETAQVNVSSDALPQILQGVPVEYRHVAVEIDRDRFTLNPTSCIEQFVRAEITSIAGSTAHPSDRFQAADCASLGFSPKLALRLDGGVKRTAHPKLRAVLRAKSGQANIRRVSVALPHSEFLDQAHIGTICTRVQFAADACPKASVYGNASVTTPLLDRPLRGLVYLRSSSHQLPDLVIDLKGPLHIVLAGRIDSVNGGIRTTFESTPDAPVQKFILDMKGGRKGLLVNSKNLCVDRNWAMVEMDAQNGKAQNSRVELKNDC
jgi:hypothetical protein